MLPNGIVLVETLLVETNPVVSKLQFVSAAARLNMLPLLRPRYKVEGDAESAVKALTKRFVRPSLNEIHRAPLFVLRKTPPLVAAYKVDGSEGSRSKSLIVRLASPALELRQRAAASVVLKIPLDVPA